jgi:hypothetical protein
MEFVYKMSWFESKRHTISHTDMYFARESDTRWGHHNPLCTITVVAVERGTPEYESAIESTKTAIENILKGEGYYSY